MKLYCAFCHAEAKDGDRLVVEGRVLHSCCLDSYINCGPRQIVFDEKTDSFVEVPVPIVTFVKI